VLPASVNKRVIKHDHLIVAVLLLTVFSLPFHFHFFTPAAQLGKECSCYQGARNQTGPAPAANNWTPSFQAAFVVAYEPQIFGRLALDSRAIRAPPVLAFL